MVGDFIDAIENKFSEECGDKSTRKRTVLCANEATMEVVADYLCGDQRAKPPIEEACKGKPCKVTTHYNFTAYANLYA